MSLLLFILFFIITIIFSCMVDEDLAFVPGIVCLIFLLVTVISGFKVVNGKVIDSKIEMYQEENKNIETQMDILVEKYMDYESETFEELKGESSVTLVSLYPELKTDELVKSQVEVYTANNKTIKELKEEKINLSTWKWWLYFGG